MDNSEYDYYLSQLLGGQVDAGRPSSSADQQVPPGNPIAEYLRSRAEQESRTAGNAASRGGAGLSMVATGNPVLGLGGAGYGIYELIQMIRHARKAGELKSGANAWENQFGTGDPGQSLPGTQGGPGYRRHYGD